MRVAQRLRQGVREDVNASDLPGSKIGHIQRRVPDDPVADDVTGCRAQSAVFLVHAESLRRAPGGVQKEAAERLALRSGCYHSGTMNVL